MKPSFARLLALLAVTGCLPEGPPPTGTRLVEERHLVGARFLPDGRLLYARRTGFRELYPGGDLRPVSELWAMPAAGGAAVRLVEGTDWESGQPVDAQGRLWALRLGELDPSSGQQSHEVARVDAAGVQTASGRVFEVLMSPGGTRVLLRRADGTAVVRELDDREIAVTPDSYAARFVGEAFVYQARTALWVLPPGASQPVLLAPDVLRWRENRASTELELALITGDPGGGGPPGPAGEPAAPPSTLQVVRGTTARTLWRGRVASDPVFSPFDDRLAIVEDTAAGALLLHVFRTGSDERQDVELGPVRRGPVLNLAQVFFRPGSTEIWCAVPGGLKVVRADGSVLAVDQPDLDLWPFVGPQDPARREPGRLFAEVGDGAAFSSDGRRWLYTLRYNSIYLGQADDPNGAGLLIESRGDAPIATVEEVLGGRRLLMTGAPPGQARHFNMTLIDPDTDQRRLLATSVGRSVVGARRLLVLANESGGLFDLRLIDLETGEDRLLAQNVTTFSTPTCAGCDPTAPGAPVAYVVHARVPFEYDGLWRVELP